MVCGSCSFETPRLCARDWHSPVSVDWRAYNLVDCVSMLLTDAVTASLPPDWHGPFSAERAQRWVSGRDAETTNLLVVDRRTREPVGFMFLFESEDKPTGGVEVRLGYVLAESAWGKGLASELVHGLVDWCRKQPIASIIGGVGRENHPSRRVLEKNGFKEILSSDETQTERYYGLTLIS